MPGKAVVPVSSEADNAPLSQTEQSRFEKLEQAISRNVGAFVELGLALPEIRDSRLYRAEFPTFEAYCNERWDLGRNYVNKQIAAAQVAQEVGTIVPIESEGVARELTGLLDQPKILDRVAKKLAAAPKVTAAVAKEIVDSITPDAAKKPKEPKTTPDEWRQVLIEGLRSARLAAQELGLKKLATQLTAMLKEAGRARK